jgi:hypothetical protein
VKRPRYESVGDRLLANSVAVDCGHTSECWHWLGNVSSRGYGRLTARRRGRHVKLLAHRVAFEAFKGRLGRGQTVDHLCRTTTCIAPDHLEAISRAENSRRRWEAR